MQNWVNEISVEEFDIVEFLNGEYQSPQVVRGLVSDWPLVVSALDGSNVFREYLGRYAVDRPVTVYQAPASAKGRIFYNESQTGFNFERMQLPFGEFFNRLDELANVSEPDTLYMGSTMLDHWFPGIRDCNDIEFNGMDTLVSLWLGNQTLVAPHFDFPENLACVVSGTRKFTLFAPDQIANLYPGSIDFTPSGQPISMVDTREPDLDEFPNFTIAQNQAQHAELKPGDAIYIPSMWWHQVESFDSHSALVNYWWRVTPPYLGSPLLALKHSLMVFSGLPESQKESWKQLFNYYLFDANKRSFEYIDSAAKGVLGELSKDDVTQIKKQLIHFLKA
ncbi:MAG: cupin-like domain-containing protein [Gammaproteobacteria bacterium]|nr:cupin-like domain-containing protein [Gammaproteobacteria bacterium]